MEGTCLYCLQLQQVFAPTLNMFVCLEKAPLRTCTETNQVRAHLVVVTTCCTLQLTRCSLQVSDFLTSCHFLSAAFDELQSTVLRATQSQICWWSSRFCSLNQNAAQIVLWSLISRRGETLSKPAADYRLSVCVRVCAWEKERESVCLWVWPSHFVLFSWHFCQKALRAVV